MAVNNPILLGFEWSQAFVLSAGALLSGDTLRAELRYNVADVQPVVTLTTGAGLSFSGNQITMQLTEAQTRSMQLLPIKTMFVIVRGAKEIPYGVLITIPTVRPPTRSIV